MPLLQHGVVAQRDVGRLVALHALAVPGPVVDVLLHALRDLVLVDLVGHVGAGARPPRESSTCMSQVCWLTSQSFRMWGSKLPLASAMM